MTEKAFELKIKKLLKDNNIFFVKYFGCGITTSGTPDLLCCFKGRFLAIELKAENGRLSELQKHKIELIRQSGGLAFCLKPSDFETFKNFLKNS